MRRMIGSGTPAHGARGFRTIQAGFKTGGTRAATVGAALPAGVPLPKSNRIESNRSWIITETFCARALCATLLSSALPAVLQPVGSAEATEALPRLQAIEPSHVAYGAKRATSPMLIGRPSSSMAKDLLD